MTSTINSLRWAAASLAAASLVMLSSCTSGVGALAGGGGGASGAVAEDGRRDVAAGAAALKENEDKKEGTANSVGDRPAPPATSGTYPKGFKTDNPHRVISPFKPNNLIDISENPKTGQPFVSGDLVKDPSNGQIFRIP